MHVTRITSMLSLPSLLPANPALTDSESKLSNAHVCYSSVLVTTTPEQFANQPGIITNPHPFVLFTAAAAAAAYSHNRTPIYICAFESKVPFLVSVSSFLHKYLQNAIVSGLLLGRSWPIERKTITRKTAPRSSRGMRSCHSL